MRTLIALLLPQNKEERRAACEGVFLALNICIVLLLLFIIFAGCGKDPHPEPPTDSSDGHIWTHHGLDPATRVVEVEKNRLQTFYEDYEWFQPEARIEKMKYHGVEVELSTMPFPSSMTETKQ